MNVEPVFETLLNHYTSKSFLDELKEAKQEFFESAGIVDDEDHQFEPRMAQFLDWYLFSRPMKNVEIPPIQLALQSNDFLAKVSDKDQELLNSLSNTTHSLFEFVKVRGDDVYVRDLFTKKKVVLRGSGIFVGFNPDEIFDTRVIPIEGNFVFAKGFCFHPPAAKKFILKEVKKVRHLDHSHHENLMFRLLKMRYKLEQYKHIKMEYIYTNDPKLKI